MFYWMWIMMVTYQLTYPRKKLPRPVSYMPHLLTPISLLISNISTGQFLRMCRICSGANQFEDLAIDLHQRFKEKGYRERDILKAYTRAKETSRDLLLTQQKKRKQDNQMDPILSQYLTEKPSITYRRSKTLKDMLVHSHHKGPNINKIFSLKGLKWGCKPCGGCVACANVERTEEFWDSSRQKKYRITRSITCTNVWCCLFCHLPLQLNLYRSYFKGALAQSARACLRN
ncbi:uncharacterized protein LOC130293388 [Hyla sarda]|uniref:uncharacterized protein LOC130293388 n=1 Tax=Hyla sarda TaxID=327740 RepID=UPI0024C3C121|nr:uncharacterized protein LOC130293388 [Hyla sarda]